MHYMTSHPISPVHHSVTVQKFKASALQPGDSPRQLRHRGFPSPVPAALSGGSRPAYLYLLIELMKLIKLLMDNGNPFTGHYASKKREANRRRTLDMRGNALNIEHPMPSTPSTNQRHVTNSMVEQFNSRIWHGTGLNHALLPSVNSLRCPGLHTSAAPFMRKSNKNPNSYY